ncbi:hypothetical protein [Bradyrhizobium sp.]|uniref:hypothetical protein n=1 Tax=Bradyrhizobium sp. TaxID=376 RepID=UPI003C39F208
MIQQENALLHARPLSKIRFDGQDIVNDSKICLDDERIALVVTRACSAEQFGRHLMPSLEHGANACQSSGTIGNDMNEHEAGSVSPQSSSLLMQSNRAGDRLLLGEETFELLADHVRNIFAQFEPDRGVRGIDLENSVQRGRRPRRYRYAGDPVKTRHLAISFWHFKLVLDGSNGSGRQLDMNYHAEPGGLDVLSRSLRNVLSFWRLYPRQI